MDRDRARWASADAVGTLFLVAVVVGSAIAAQRLSPNNTGVELLTCGRSSRGGDNYGLRDEFRPLLQSVELWKQRISLK